jgi:UDP:flavonoid glycosyltransferase YjiC (YdhE family)
VTPICADQFAHAAIIQEIGAGFGFKDPLPKIKASELAKAIMSATMDVTNLNVERLGKKIRQEEDFGLKRAADMVDGFARGRVKYQREQWIRLKRPATAASGCRIYFRN